MKISCRLRAFGPLSVGNLRTLIMVSANRNNVTLMLHMYFVYIALDGYSLQDIFKI